MGNNSIESKDLTDEEGSRTSKDPSNNGNNGNPAQSAGRVSAQEQDANPAPLNKDASETNPDEIPDSLSNSRK